jgi:hypothetical protein
VAPSSQCAFVRKVGFLALRELLAINSDVLIPKGRSYSLMLCLPASEERFGFGTLTRSYYFHPFFHVHISFSKLPKELFCSQNA